MLLDWDFMKIRDKSYTARTMSDRAREITDRMDMLNRNFEWSEKNVAHMEKLFNHVTALQLQMYNEVAQMKKDFELKIASGEEMYKDYDIEAFIKLRRGIKFPFADEYLLSFMEYCSEFDFSLSGVYANSCSEMRSAQDMLSLDLNWNIEIFDYFRKRNDNNPYIPYLFHAVWQDGCVYSLEDLLYIQPEDFIICKKVNL